MASATASAAGTTDAAGCSTDGRWVSSKSSDVRQRAVDQRGGRGGQTFAGADDAGLAACRPSGATARSTAWSGSVGARALGVPGQAVADDVEDAAEDVARGPAPAARRRGRRRRTSASCWTGVRPVGRGQSSRRRQHEGERADRGAGGADDVAAARARGGTRETPASSSSRSRIVSTMLMPCSTSSIRCTGSSAWPTPGLICSNAIVSPPATRTPWSMQPLRGRHVRAGYAVVVTDERRVGRPSAATSRCRSAPRRRAAPDAGLVGGGLAGRPAVTP